MSGYTQQGQTGDLFQAEIDAQGNPSKTPTVDDNVFRKTAALDEIERQLGPASKQITCLPCECRPIPLPYHPSGLPLHLHLHPEPDRQSSFLESTCPPHFHWMPFPGPYPNRICPRTLHALEPEPAMRRSWMAVLDVTRKRPVPVDQPIDELAWDSHPDGGLIRPARNAFQ